jgi:hypothetical protein
MSRPEVIVTVTDYAATSGAGAAIFYRALLDLTDGDDEALDWLSVRSLATIAERADADRHGPLRHLMHRWDKPRRAIDLICRRCHTPHRVTRDDLLTGTWRDCSACGLTGAALSAPSDALDVGHRGIDVLSHESPA